VNRTKVVGNGARENLNVNFGIKLKRSIEKSSKTLGGKQKRFRSKWNQLNQCPAQGWVVEPKAKKEYKTKKEKEKYAVVEELIALRQTMVGEELRDVEAQSIKNMVEEDARPLHAKIRRKQRGKTPPRKSKKKTKGKDKASPSKVKAHEGLLHPSPKGREKLRLMWAC
jgi:hypothetical protein